MAKILVVDDDEMNRDMLSRRLLRKGYEVALAVNGNMRASLVVIEFSIFLFSPISLRTNATLRCPPTRMQKRAIEYRPLRII